MTRSKEIILASNSFNFLKSYKLSLTNLFKKNRISVQWMFPKDNEKKLDILENNKIKFKILSSSRRGAFSFIEMYFRFLNFLQHYLFLSCRF